MTREVDTLIIGSGIAGLFTALCAAERGSVALITKSALQESNTRYAQGGIAAVLFDDDEVESHVSDTLSAGAGLCDEEAVRVLCAEGPARVRELIALGVAFDRDGAGLARGLEGAHSKPRVLHAGGDATGAHIESALASALAELHVSITEHATLIDLVAEGDVEGGGGGGVVVGAQFADGDGNRFTVHSRSVVIATGGAGRVYEHTTNPAVATGDGVAAAFRVGAVVRDAEMYQFHPTALALPGDPFLVSEAVRGEGAILRNNHGESFMGRYHPLADLAPRDVVARAIATEMSHQHGKPVVLDATSLGAKLLADRFPSINEQCALRGVKWSTTPVPVTPAAHYWMGGIATDLYGRTNMPGLFAVGEVACTGVHGANRLASNSLLEGIVFGSRAISAIAGDEGRALPTFIADELPRFGGGVLQCEIEELRRLMWENVGLVRDEHGLAVAVKQLAEWTSTDTTVSNMLTVARLITAGAMARLESRGAHYREDFQGLDLRRLKPRRLKLGAPRHFEWVAC